MANDMPVEAPVDERPAAPQVPYSARVGATCMWWAMLLGVGIVIAFALFWGITHLSTIGT